MKYQSVSPIRDSLIWKDLNYFNPNENWGDANKMDVRLLWGLERIRHSLGRKITINCAYEKSGHAPKSFHRLGMAVDFVAHPLAPDMVDNIFDIYITILNMWHGGIGVYPFWNTPGYHLDIGPDRTWVRDKEGVYHYDSEKIFLLINKT